MQSFVHRRRRSLRERFSPRQPNLAVCCHLYYPEVAAELVTRLATLTTDYTLFVTYPGSLSPLLSRRLALLDRDIHFIPVENVGRDVMPFLRCLQHPAIWPHEFVVKLHTKRGHSSIGDLWRDAFFDSILGSSDRFADVLEQFKADPALMMAGPAQIYLSARTFMYDNQDKVSRLSRALLDGFILDDWGFFAGTMFWARRNIFDVLLDFETKGFEFSTEKGAQDGELAHAFERIFGLLPRRNGKVGLLGGPPEYALEVLADGAAPLRRAITQIFQRSQAQNTSSTTSLGAS